MIECSDCGEQIDVSELVDSGIITCNICNKKLFVEVEILYETKYKVRDSQ